MSLSKKEQQLAFELVCAQDYKLAAKLREVFADSDRLDYLEKRTALSSSGLSINPNMFQKVPAKDFCFMWRFTRTEPKPTLRAAIDDSAKEYPLLEVADWMAEEGTNERMADAAYTKMVYEIRDMVRSVIGNENYHMSFADMGADELDMVDLTLSVEEHYSIEIPDADVDLWKTTQDIINYVQRRTAAEIEVKK